MLIAASANNAALADHAVKHRIFAGERTGVRCNGLGTGPCAPDLGQHQRLAPLQCVFRHLQQSRSVFQTLNVSGTDLDFFFSNDCAHDIDELDIGFITRVDKESEIQPPLARHTSSRSTQSTGLGHKGCRSLKRRAQ